MIHLSTITGINTLSKLAKKLNTKCVLTKFYGPRKNLTEFQHLPIMAFLHFLRFEARLYIGLKKVVVAFSFRLLSKF